ncbi:hypothetical protein QZH41_004797 [Actinostola sp. cb2023]|nr:hypothetical protein QZH41_004797 [Actinostola sp. cb2023]
MAAMMDPNNDIAESNVDQDAFDPLRNLRFLVRAAGWEYAVAIYIAFNGFAFLFILLSYVAIFVKVRASSKAVRSNMNNDAALARRVVLIILTDFFCWIPVVIIGCLSLTQGFEDPQGQAYAWIAVFVLPINSSLNPILYTFSNPQFRRLFACKKCCSHHDVRGPKDNQRCENELRPLPPDNHTVHTVIGTPEGDKVLIKNFGQGAKWKLGTIYRRNGPLSYQVQYELGVVARRHVDHLLERREQRPLQSSLDEETGEEQSTPEQLIEDPTQAKDNGTAPAIESQTANPPQPSRLERPLRERKPPRCLEDYITN